MRGLFVNPKINSFFIYRIAIFAACAATIIAAGG
jgi:hypothetical protein